MLDSQQYNVNEVGLSWATALPVISSLLSKEIRYDTQKIPNVCIFVKKCNERCVTSEFGFSGESRSKDVKVYLDEF